MLPGEDHEQVHCLDSRFGGERSAGGLHDHSRQDRSERPAAGHGALQTMGWAGGFKGDSPLRSSIANPLNEARLRDAIAANLQIAGIPWWIRPRRVRPPPARGPIA